MFMNYEVILLEEYKVCQQALQEKDKSIWQSFGILGAGTLGSFALIARETTPAALGVFIIGLVSSSASWIWWVIASRWWQLQHTDLLRMRHIEKELAPKYSSPLRIHYSVIRDGGALPALSSVPSKHWDFIPLHQQRWFGVQNAMIFYPLIVTIAWATYTISTVLGGDVMSNWIITALVGITGIAIGLLSGIFIRAKTLGTQLDQIRALCKEISESVQKKH